ncbi:right-handed parallel beta-helix repeat-containing protein [Streptomyces sp. RY43-2]|uniref:Right-handed parallel beta-helix repeat-containing protein n=1 Tax=Streptomyces macrolidinus TaxID=2952607 RepID=A0ABT0Z6P9_9ACTN|nr:right-handed parallel beta-helix repeat-containing protein [Streptomyces macrolidinus]MCN9239434.1 right-handed parallel beta-helix repeat-containing protein [Streptomyces macrolidinus]
MRNRPSLAALLVGCFIALAMTVGAAPPAAAASVIHVAPNGTDTPGCGTVAAPCASIPFAYNEAAPGDTIRVEAGTYVMTTPLVIRKANLRFQGAKAGVDARTRTPGGPGETVITSAFPPPNAVDMWVVSADGVSIDGFTFTGNASGAGVSTSENFSGYVVQNTIFSNNLKGFAPSSNGVNPSVFRQNYYFDNDNATLHPGTEGNGVFTFRPLANAVFEDSKFQDNDNSPINISGGEVAGGTRNITIRNNEMPGEFPVVLVAVSQVVITQNSMVGGFSGVQVSGACQDIQITHNTITDKTHGAILLFTGFAAVTNTGITVADNTIERTATVAGRFGVEISRSSDVTVRHNVIADTGQDAIGFTLRGQTVPSSDATITQNTIIRSGGSGIVVQAGAYTGTMAVNKNRIVDSGSGNGLVNDAADAQIDATLNWWGCNDMPNGAGCDHLAGTAVGQIDFSPWLILTISSVPADIAAGQQARITASLQHDSNGNTVPGPFFQPVLVDFSTTVGTVTPNPVLTDPSLNATTTWPAGQPRPQSICATVDNQTVCLNFEPVPGTGSVIAKVVTGKSKAPVPGVEVNVVDPGGQVVGTCTTDAAGTCDVLDLQPGTYRVCVVNVPHGFNRPKEPCTGPVTVVANEETTVVIALRKIEHKRPEHKRPEHKRPEPHCHKWTCR